MKKKLIVGIIAIMLVSIFAVAGSATIPEPSQSKGIVDLPADKGGTMKLMQVACTPNSGFEWCYEDDYTANGCTAEYRIHGKYIDQTARSCQINGQLKTCYVGNTLTTKVDTYSADELYLLQGFSSWSDGWSHIDCDGNGCNYDSHVKEISDGTVTLETAPAQIRNYAYVAYDKDYCSCGDYCDDYWTYVYGAAGYTGPWSNMYLVRCLENSDCPSGKICDKSGTWQQWECKNDPCASVTCNNYCAGTTRYYSGQCSQSNGQCSYSQENCATQNYYDAYVNYCSGNELRKHRIYHQYSCSNGGCAELHGIYWTDDQLVQNCEFGCNDQTKQCNADPCTNVACNDYCDGATSYHSGQCVSGTCAFQIAENSTTCGYEEPEPTPEPTPEPPAEEPEEPTPTTEGILNPSLYIDGVKIFEYDGVLDTMVYVNDYSTVLNAYLEDCTPDENGVCKVPIEIKGDSDGIIKLKNLNILFEEKEQEEPIEEEPTTPEEPGEIEEPEEPIEEEPVTPEEPVEEEPVTPEEPIEEVPPQVNLVAKLWFKHCAKSTAPFGGGYAQGSAILFDADGDGGLEEHHMISVAMGFPEQTMQYRTPENYVIKKLKIGDNWRLAIGVDGYNYLYQYYEGGKCISVIEGDPENEVCVDSQNIKVSCIVEENIPVSEPEPVENEPIEEEIVEEETEEPVPEVPIIDTSKTSWDSQFQKKKSSTRPIGDGYAEGAEIELDSNGDGKTECYSMKSVALGFEEQVLPFTTTEGYTIKRLKIGDNWNNIAIQVGDQSYLFGLINC